ncbi:DUF4334 domain-containing protein [Terriglobus saanensis]|uniref:DUF4334 domain-containing protein n=1 Tax=Terriglobus saanensis (strain ATCC BAA-1853 / DSM 23119 / SP1PR4) TaxID=401053 RepID=E8V5V4_TERSS|nr:DUF4334 domain-containing protein [Terriglobus saanensis]ADV83772.1 hypothetical protein AciPR4_3013 [Terriglobus saanensis SP1PR4]
MENKLIEAFEQYRNQKFIKDDSKLLELFDHLDPVSCDEIYSRWAGECFQTGHWAVKTLTDMKWYGKWFQTKMNCAPLICFNEEGDLFSNQILGGEGILWTAEFRGKVSATLSYDSQPMFNHFRRVDENTLMGIMQEKRLLTGLEIVPATHYLYFCLRRVAEFPAKLVPHSQADLWPAPRRAHYGV